MKISSSFTKRRTYCKWAERRERVETRGKPKVFLLAYVYNLKLQSQIILKYVKKKTHAQLFLAYHLLSYMHHDCHSFQIPQSWLSHICLYIPLFLQGCIIGFLPLQALIFLIFIPISQNFSTLFLNRCILFLQNTF